MTPTARRTVAKRLWHKGDTRAAAMIRAGLDDGCWAMRHELARMREAGSA